MENLKRTESKRILLAKAHAPKLHPMVTAAGVSGCAAAKGHIECSTRMKSVFSNVNKVFATNLKRP